MITLFSVNGLTYIGYVEDDNTKPSTAAQANLLLTSGVTYSESSTEYVYIKSPARISFSLGKTSETKAKLSWTITPMCFGAIMSNNANNWWMFKRDNVIFSSVTEDEISESTLISAYKALVN